MNTKVSFELSAADVAEIKQQAIESIVADLRKRFNASQEAAEIRNAAIKTVAAELSSRLYTNDLEINEAIKRCVESIESRVQSRIQKLLNKGITIRFTDDE